MKKIGLILIVLIFSISNISFGSQTTSTGNNSIVSNETNKFETILTKAYNLIQKASQKDPNFLDNLLSKIKNAKVKLKSGTDSFTLITLLEKYVEKQISINKQSLENINNSVQSTDQFEYEESKTSSTNNTTTNENNVIRNFDYFKDTLKEYFNFTDYDTEIDDNIVNDIIEKCNKEYCYNEYSKYSHIKSFVIKFRNKTDINEYKYYNVYTIWNNTYKKKLSKFLRIDYKDCKDNPDFDSYDQCIATVDNRSKMCALMETDGYYYKSVFFKEKDKVLEYLKKSNIGNQSVNTGENIKEIKTTDSDNVKYLKRLYKGSGLQFDNQYNRLCI